MNFIPNPNAWRDDQKRMVLSDIDRIRELRQYVQACKVRLKKFKKLEHYYREEIRKEETALHAAQKEIRRLERDLAAKTFR